MRFVFPFALLLLPLYASADEAVLRHGRRIRGQLKCDDAGRLRFRSTPSGGDIALSEIEYVRFPDATVSAFSPAPLRLTLSHGQKLTVAALDLDQSRVSCRTFWSEKLQLPRRAVVAITHPPSLVTLIHEDFESDSPRLKLAGSPPFDEKHHVSGRRSLALANAGQSATLTLAKPLAAGRIDVRFHDPGQTAGARWLVEADFAGAQRLQVGLAGGEDGYRVATDLAAADTKPLPRTSGWHRLSVRFHPDYVLVGIDDHLLFESKSGPGKPLNRVRLACEALAKTGAVRGAFCFDDLVLAQTVEELPRPAGDRAQDEVWLLSGDQLFGRVLRADQRAIHVEGRLGKRAIPWSTVRGIFLKADPGKPRTSDGQHVRVWFRAGLSESDQLEGVIRTFDERKLVLRHALLGEVTIERNRLHRLRALFYGQRIELSNGRSRLGEAAFRCPFRLDAVPTAARLRLSLHDFQPTAGGGDVEVMLNGKRVDTLSRHVDRIANEARPVTISLPARALHAGENLVELRIPPDGSARRARCVVSDLAIELPR